MSAIHFVRHGRTVLNEQRRTQGSSDSPLTPEGRRGARATAEHLGRLPLARAYLSPQGRVIQTADILLAGRPDVERVVLDGLREYDYGIYDGGPDEEMLRALDPARHLPGVLSGAHPGAPGGIGAADYLAHVDAALARVVVDLREDAHAGRPDARVLVVSHGMTLMTLLGAGGAAKSILAQAILDGVSQISVFVRSSSMEKTRPYLNKLQEQTGFKVGLYALEDVSELQASIAESDLLVNATSVGMDGQSSPVPENIVLPETLLVADIIYQPFETPFLKWARSQGNPAINGLGMLLYQAAEAFQLWKGKEMPTEEIWQSLTEKYQ